MDKSTEKGDTFINCVAVRFDVKDGIMEEKAIYLDTTNMQISAKSEVNFVEQQIDIKMAPRAKNPEFFNMAIPNQAKRVFCRLWHQNRCFPYGWSGRLLGYQSHSCSNTQGPYRE